MATIEHSQVSPTKRLLSKDYIERYKQSFIVVLAMLACAILLTVLVSIIVFIGMQGGRYFLPMSTYQITTHLHSTELTSRSSQSVKTTVEYVLSHDSEHVLRERAEQQYSHQLPTSRQQQTSVNVSVADNLFLLNTVSGKKYVGEFVSIQNGDQQFRDLAKLANFRTSVSALQHRLSRIQFDQLRPLHEDIKALNDNLTEVTTIAYQKKLDAFTKWQQDANIIMQKIERYRVNIRLDTNQVMSVGVLDLQDFYQPNHLSWWQMISFSAHRISIFLTDYPKQAASSGGVFPAIFGTLFMVIIMAIVVTPFGVIAAIYLHEYAPVNKLTSVIRICVSNMAAVPSIVYGVFGLSFFVYTLGGSIDSLLYADKLPSPTFGAPGLLWAALTMGILTLPVVIVASEEGLSRVPQNLRAGALALGATKYETIIKVVLPMASPGMLTGVILAIARAAGEVAPLILVGAVKFAPTLPIDSEFPFVHFERQFMHLGVFVYDGAFHNQTESQVSSLMFATCLLLLIIVFLLNISAIVLRNKLRNKYERL